MFWSYQPPPAFDKTSSEIQNVGSLLKRSDEDYTSSNMADLKYSQNTG